MCLENKILVGSIHFALSLSFVRSSPVSFQLPSRNKHCATEGLNTTNICAISLKRNPWERVALMPGDSFWSKLPDWIVQYFEYIFSILICTLMSEEHFKLLWDCEASHTEKNCSHGNMWIKMDTFNNSFSSFAMYICFQIPLAAWLSWDIHSILCCCWKRQTKNCWRQHQQMDFYHEESMVCCHISIVSSVCLRCVPPFYVFKNGYKSEATCGRLFPRRASQKL